VIVFQTITILTAQIIFILWIDLEIQMEAHKMTKKQQKAHSQRVQTTKELLLITVGFTWMWEMIEKKTSDEDKKTRDYTLAKHICNQLGYKIKAYRPLQNNVVDMWNDVRKEINEGEHNVFLAGLAMLSVHMEVKRKNINVGLDKEIIELQELAYEFFDAESINNAADWAEEVKAALKI